MITPLESSMKKAAWDLFPRKRRTVYRNALFAILKTSFIFSQNSFQAISSDSLIFVAAA